MFYIKFSKKMDSLPSDSIRQRLFSMSQHSCFNENEKLSLIQILSLLSNLEAISNDQETSFDEDNIKLMAVSFYFIDFHFCLVEYSKSMTYSFIFSFSFLIGKNQSL